MPPLAPIDFKIIIITKIGIPKAIAYAVGSGLLKEISVFNVVLKLINIGENIPSKISITSSVILFKLTLKFVTIDIIPRSPIALKLKIPFKKFFNFCKKPVIKSALVLFPL